MCAFDQFGIGCLTDARSMRAPISSPVPDSKPDAITAADAREPFVYDLRIKGHGSEPFYSDIASFSARVVAEIESRASAVLDGYSRYETEVLREAPRSRAEYGLEFLTLGMALRVYGAMAARTPWWVVVLARELFRLRRRTPRIKPVADFLRAGLFQFFMRRKPELAETRQGANPGPADREPHKAYGQLPQLIEWMQATGEFEQEWKRLDHWRSYLCALPASDAQGWVAVSGNLFDWFSVEAEAALGMYTAGVVGFLKNTYAPRFWREDHIFCGRLAVEYHLGMVAAEVMNAGLREDFERKPHKVVLVPTCMRGAHSDRCKAALRGLDMRCTGCDPECAVDRITRRMRRVGVDVYLVPHSSGFSRWLARWQEDPEVGVAAVACMMNILAGGYEMRARRIASQCVPLDYPGCRKHWTREGVPTSVNEERLVRIVTGRKD